MKFSKRPNRCKLPTCDNIVADYVDLCSEKCARELELLRHNEELEKSRKEEK